MKTFLAFFVGMIIGAILTTYERKWECDAHGYWRTSWFTHECKESKP